MSHQFQLFLGPMFAGKTTKLLQTIHYYKRYYRLPIILIMRSQIDTRSVNHQLQTHINQTLTACIVHDLATAQKHWQRFQRRLKVVFISEIQFFGPEIITMINFFTSHHVRVVGEGLDLDFKRRPFPIIPALRELQPQIRQLQASCSDCFAKAPYSFRLVATQELFVPGDQKLYCALCRSCYEQKSTTTT